MKNLLLVLLSFAAAPAWSIEFKPVLELNAGPSYSSMTNGPGSLKGSGRMFFVPVLGLGAKDMLGVVMLADLRNNSKAITEEGESYLERLLVLLKPTYKHKFSNFDMTLFGNAKRTVNIEFFEQPWSMGLYDSEEFGGGVKFTKDLKASWLESGAFGLAWAHRSYPNYHYPLPTGAKNYYIKDFDATKLDFDFEFPKAWAWTSTLSYELALRNYYDSYVYKKDGTLDLGATRSDLFHTLESKNTRALSKSWVLNADLNVLLNSSNQNSFDFAAAKFVPDFYSYRSIALTPALTWLPQEKADGHSLGLSYQVLFRDYAGRPIRNSNGVYTEGKQADVEHWFTLDGAWVFSPRWKAYGATSYGVARSNQSLENLLKYTYEIFNVQAGLSFKL